MPERAGMVWVAMLAMVCYGRLAELSAENFLRETGGREVGLMRGRYYAGVLEASWRRQANASDLCAGLDTSAAAPLV